MIPYPFQQGGFGRGNPRPFEPINDPTDLPGLIGWYDASNTGSLTLSGAAVTNWNDLSASANHLSQATGTARYTSGATVNGLNAVTGDGGDSMVFSVNPVLPSNSYYAFAVSGQTANFILLDGNGAGANPYILNPRTTGALLASIPGGNITGFTGLNPAISDGSINLMSHTTNGAGTTLSFNSSTFFGTPAGGFTVTIFGGRATFRLVGTLCEVFFGTAALTAGEITAAKLYLKNKWNTP